MALTVDALVSWELAKQYLGLDDEDQAYLELLINAASQTANRETRRRLAARDLELLVDGDGTSRVLVPYPIQAVMGLWVDREGLFGPETLVTDYRRYDELGILARGTGVFPQAPQVVKVSLRAGYEVTGATPDVPADLQAAVLEIVSFNLKRFRSETLIGVKSVNVPQGMSTAYEITIPLNALQILAGYRDGRLL